jgi:hypothetical protein
LSINWEQRTDDGVKTNKMNLVSLLPDEKRKAVNNWPLGVTTGSYCFSAAFVSFVGFTSAETRSFLWFRGCSWVY